MANLSLQLSDVDWELRLQMANSSMSKLKVPIGLLQLTLSANDEPEKVQMEFSHDELYSLYNQVKIKTSLIYIIIKTPFL